MGNTENPYIESRKSSANNPRLNVELESVKTELRQNYLFSVFSILPGLSGDLKKIFKMAKTMGVGTKEADYYSERLFASGLWKVTSEGVCTNFDFLDLGDLSIKDYLASTVYIIAHLSEKKPYSYDTLSIVTSRSHVRNFLKKVNLALKELHESSAQAKDEKNCLFSWTHSGTIEIQLKDKVEKE